MALENTLPAFHVMAKPTGSKCNLDCAYCFYLKKEQMYPESDFRMSDAVMEQYIRQTIEGHRTPEVTIAWQGGEPTLMGLDFFQRAVEVEKKYAKPGLNWLCAGLKAFYAHTERPMRIMAELLKRGRYADEIMPMLAAEEAAKLKKAFASSGRNDPCPCGSGKKFKRCHADARVEGRVTSDRSDGGQVTSL